MSKTAVVFGGSGFIGRLIISQLAEAGYTIRVPTRVLAKAEPLRQLGAVGQITPIVVDAANAAAVSTVLRGADVVINAIGILAENSRQKFDAVQTEIPGVIARAAAHNNVRAMVHISAIGADGNSASAYARSKAAGEGMVRALFPPATILRPSLVFGPGDGFFERFAKMAVFAPMLPLIAGGKNKFQPVYVADVAAAVMAAIDIPQAQGRTYELGGPAVYSFKKLLEIMLLATQRRRVLLPVPMAAARVLARVLQRLPGQMLTVDQLALLQTDNVVSHNTKTLHDLGIQPTALEAILPTYMDCYRPKGRFR